MSEILETLHEIRNKLFDVYLCSEIFQKDSEIVKNIIKFFPESVCLDNLELNPARWARIFLKNIKEYHEDYFTKNFVNTILYNSLNMKKEKIIKSNLNHV